MKIFGDVCPETSAIQDFSAYALSSDIATSTSVTELRAIVAIVGVILAFTASSATTFAVIAIGLLAFIDSSQISTSQESVISTYGTIS